jgi:D-3-phosphoglycerate dehydrogenase
VSFVNAPQLATERGLTFRESMSTTAREYVNLVTLRGRVGNREVHVAGTLAGHRGEPRIVGIDDHAIEVPPARHMLVVRNQDVPGMIGRVGTILGDAGVNIKDMRVGEGPSGEAALMVLTTATPVPAAVAEELRAQPGIVDAKAIELD